MIASSSVITLKFSNYYSTTDIKKDKFITNSIAFTKYKSIQPLKH